MKKLRIFSASVLILGMLFMSISIPSAMAAPNPAVLPPDARVQGLTLGDWTAKFWQALASIPADQNPLLGHLWPTCNLDQVGNVGVGAGYGASGSVDCEMPNGMILYVPIVGAECSNIEPPPFYGGNEAELRACALQFVPSNLSATIDGIPVNNLGKYTTLSPLFQFTVPEDNFLGVPA